MRYCFANRYAAGYTIIKKHTHNLTVGGQDFLGYDYTFGDEIGGPIMVPMLVCGPPIPPIAIVATGRTGRSLRSLIGLGYPDKFLDLDFFEDAESGRAFLRRALEKRKKPPPAGR